MKLEEIIQTSDIFTDENLAHTDLLKIANTGISRINNECNTKFPLFNNVTEEYTAIPKFWLRTLLNNYLSYGVKMNDTSLNEADRYLDEFYKLLKTFKEKLTTMAIMYEQGDTENGVSSDYLILEGLGGVYGIDTSDAVNIGYFGNMGNGGCY